MGLGPDPAVVLVVGLEGECVCACVDVCISVCKKRVCVFFFFRAGGFDVSSTVVAGSKEY